MSSLSLLKTFFALLLGLIAAGWEIAVRPFLPPVFDIPALLPLIVLLLIGSTRGRAYAATIVGAIVLQMYTIGVQDALFLRWIGIVFVLDLLSTRYLTNRSFYVTVALASIGFILEQVSSYVVGHVAWWVGLSHYPWTMDSGFVWSFLWNAVLVGGGFFVLAFFTKRFTPSIERTISRWQW